MLNAFNPQPGDFVFYKDRPRPRLVEVVAVEGHVIFRDRLQLAPQHETVSRSTWNAVARGVLERPSHNPTEPEALCYCVPPQGDDPGYVVVDTFRDRDVLLRTEKGQTNLTFNVLDGGTEGVVVVFTWDPFPSVSIIPASESGQPPPIPVVVTSFEYGLTVLIQAPRGAQVVY